jgi:NDP-sugar pyrophosphorylase family protein
MQTVILMGGEGRRLWPLTEQCPKPLLKVSGRPFIEFMLDQLLCQGFDNFLFLCGYKADVFLNYVKKSPFFIKKIKNYQVSIDRELLGTAGAVKNAYQMLDENFMLINGDSYLEMDYKNFCASTDTLKIALVHSNDCSRYGEVHVGIKNIVTGMSEKSSLCNSGLINAGIYRLQKNIFFELPSKEKISLEREIIPRLIQKKILLAEIVTGFFIDMGVPKDFKRADEIFRK